MMSWSYYEPPLERDACEACGGSGIDESGDYPCDRCGGSGAEPFFIPIQKEA
jgi:hypothetical protein